MDEEGPDQPIGLLLVHGRDKGLQKPVQGPHIDRIIRDGGDMLIENLQRIDRLIEISRRPELQEGGAPL